jgi:hypothetical protein
MGHYRLLTLPLPRLRVASNSVLCLERYGSMTNPSITVWPKTAIAKPQVFTETEPMNQLDNQLHQLIEEIRRQPPSSPQRAKGVTQIIQMVLNHPKLLGKNFIANVSHEDYEDALHKTLSRFFPYKWEDFDQNRMGKFINWFNYYLKFELINQLNKNKKDSSRRVPWRQDENGEWQDPTENLSDPQTPSRYFELLEKIRSWLESEQRELRCIHLRDRPHINCSVLVQKRLLDQNPWQQLEQELEVSISALSGFYYRKCLPPLRTFLSSQNWWPL